MGAFLLTLFGGVIQLYIAIHLTDRVPVINMVRGSTVARFVGTVGAAAGISGWMDVIHAFRRLI